MTDTTNISGRETAPGFGTTALFLAAIAVGAALGLASPDIGGRLSQGVDTTLLIMVGLLFFEVRLRAVGQALTNLKFISLAWVANFVFVPIIGFAIASLFLSGQPLIFTGLMIYFLAPCTDWFLSFTRMARGDTALGAALIPINMLTQLLLLPLWLWLFTRNTGTVDFSMIPDVMLQWFLLPFLAAQVARGMCARLMPARAFDMVVEGVGILIPVVTAVLIVQIFAANTPVMAAHAEIFGLVLLAIFVFFIATYLMSEALAGVFGLAHPQKALLSMTTAARNAPLMLAVTAIVIPGQPLVYAALVVGMLLEFPHLTALKQALSLRVSK